MSISHTKKYGIYYWDTFDNETFLVFQSDSFEQASKRIVSKYGSRFSTMGADRVEIVDLKGNIVKNFSII